MLLWMFSPGALGQESEGVYRIAYIELGAKGIAETSELADSVDSAKALVVGDAVSNVEIGSLGNLPSPGWETADHSPHLPENSWIIDHWDESDGLPDSNARKILQTRDGYLWIATVYGLARFDGTQFRIFDERNTGAFETAGQNCLSLAEHPDGSLWIGVDNGVVRKAGARFEQLAGVEGRVNDLVVDDVGSVWMASTKGVFESRSGQVIRHSRGNPEVRGLPSYLCLAKSEENTIWHGGSRFWGAYDSKERAWSERVDVTFSITDVLPKPDGQYLLGTSSRGVFIVSENGRSFDTVPIESGGFSGVNHVSTLFRDNSGTTFACIYHRGIFRLENGGLRPTSIVLPSDEPRSMLQDSEGAYWIGTRDMGLFRVRRSPITMVSLRQPPEFRTVNAVAEASDGSMWFCSYGGIVRVGGRDVTAYHTVPLYSTFGFPPNCLAEDEAGNMWFNFSHGGLCRLPSRISFDKPESLLPAWRFSEIAGRNLAQCLTHGPAGRIMLGTHSGLYAMVRDQSLTIMTTEGLPDNDVRCVVYSPQNELWIGTKGGILIQGKERSRMVSVENGLPDNRVYSIHFSSSRPGTTWIGTENGLAMINAGRIGTVTTRHGLPDHRILSIQEDDFDRLWILSGSGIYRAEIADLEAAAHGGSTVNCTLYGSADGLLSVATADGYQHQSCRTQDGCLWFATHAGVAVIDPKNIVDTTVTPPASVDRILAGGQLVFDQESDRLRIPRQRSDIVVIDYTVRSFTSPSTTPVQYQLLGFDQGWHDGTGQRSIRYTNLRPGKYAFHLKAANCHGRWSEPTALSFVVEPALYEHLWFRLLLAGVVLALLGLLLKFRLSTQRLRLARESREALEAERLRIAEDVHAEIGSCLAHAVSCTSGYSSPEESLLATRQALDHSFDALHEVIWLTKPKHDDFNSFCDFLMDYGERFLHQAGINVDYDIPCPESGNPSITAQIRHSLLTVYKGILSNVIRHSGATKVSCRISIDRSQISIVVSDNGRGFEAPLRGSDRRNGLDDMDSIMRKIGGTASIQSGVGRGTRIEVSAPIAVEFP